jgi:hypothetical protein
MTINLKTESYSKSTEYFNWLDKNLNCQLFLIHSFKSYHPLNPLIIAKVQDLIVKKIKELKYNGRFFLITGRPNSGSKIDRYKGIWKRNFMKIEFNSILKKCEFEFKNGDKLFNLGIAELSVETLDVGLNYLTSFSSWSYIIYDTQKKLNVKNESNWIPSSILLSEDDNLIYTYLVDKFVLRGSCLVRFGDGGEDWEFSLAY